MRALSPALSFFHLAIFALWAVIGSLDGHAQEPLTPIEESERRQSYPPLEVLITPLHYDDGTDASPRKGADSSPFQLVLKDGTTVNLLALPGGPLTHESDWRADDVFRRARRALRPERKSIDRKQALVEKPDLGMILGPHYIGLSLAQIYLSMGLDENGEKPRPNAYGTFSPIDPEICLEGGVSCRKSILGEK